MSAVAGATNRYRRPAAAQAAAGARGCRRARRTPSRVAASGREVRGHEAGGRAPHPPEPDPDADAPEPAREEDRAVRRRTEPHADHPASGSAAAAGDPCEVLPDGPRPG